MRPAKPRMTGDALETVAGAAVLFALLLTGFAFGVLERGGGQLTRYPSSRRCRTRCTIALMWQIRTQLQFLKRMGSLCLGHYPASEEQTGTKLLHAPAYR
ncbi:hypothetical protein SAMN05444164_3840 [Bradyrhizobium erythrophlei]|uniref:Uncharacterized protein n=1 Tax=Bradyrhizobium erythrophlei TaxID=1437360 RepID=A0A1H4Y8S8_9BRAD|nr:hypothetical protein SAMN05444164_3840 [Bradyrhizobium erythrophlei]